MLRIKVDEDVPGEIAAILRAAGHDASSVYEQQLTGTPDDLLWEQIQAESRVLFTADKGFADMRDFPPASNMGIVLFRLPQESRAGYIRLVRGFLAKYRLEDVAAALVVVSPASIRVRRS